MVKLFGVDIAKIANKALGPGLLPIKLVKLTQGPRDPAALTEGPALSRKVYSGRGVVLDYKLSQFDGTIIQKGDRRVLILGASLPSGIIPESNDLVQAEGKESPIVTVGRDPASASYDCQIRGA